MIRHGQNLRSSTIRDVELGQLVERGEIIATVRDSVGRRLSQTRASRTGMVIGLTQQPLVNQGDAIVHIAEILEPPATSTESDTP